MYAWEPKELLTQVTKTGSTPESPCIQFQMIQNRIRMLRDHADVELPEDLYWWAQRFFSFQAQVELTLEQTKHILSLFPAVRIELALFGPKDEEVIAAMWHVLPGYFLDSCWPLNTDEEEMARFVEMIKLQAHSMGYQLRFPLEGYFPIQEVVETSLPQEDEVKQDEDAAGPYSVRLELALIFTILMTIIMAGAFELLAKLFDLKLTASMGLLAGATLGLFCWLLPELVKGRRVRKELSGSEDADERRIVFKLIREAHLVIAVYSVMMGAIFTAMNPNDGATNVIGGAFAGYFACMIGTWALSHSPRWKKNKH
ncbi:hypothetical protein ACYPKM_01570 [Pseudomonas aeruginosa]